MTEPPSNILANEVTPTNEQPVFTGQYRSDTRIRTGSSAAELLRTGPAQITRHTGQIQTTLPTSEYAQKLRTFFGGGGSEWKGFNVHRFFCDFIWPSDMPIKPSQKILLEQVADQASLLGGGYNESRIYVMETGSGKSIAIDYLSVVFAATHIHSEGTTPTKKTLLVACPTIALANEHYLRLVSLWKRYYYTALGDTELLRMIVKRGPPVASFKLNKDPTLRPIIPFKVIAGGSGTENIIVEPYQMLQDPDASGSGQYRHIAVVVVATYEHVVSLAARSGEFMSPPFERSTIGNHLGCCIFDEVHNAEVGRSAAWGVMAWVKALNMLTVGLTATASTTLEQLFGCQISTIHVHRVCPRVVFTLPLFLNEGALISAMVDTAFCGCVQGLITKSERHTAIFIENKVQLKIILCILVSVIRSRIVDYLENERRFDPYNDAMYQQLDSAIANDPVIINDTTAYGQAIDENYSIIFSEAFKWAVGRGILLVIADWSSAVRKRMTVILSEPDQHWNLVLCTSALAEGCNMKKLKNVFIASTMNTEQKSWLPWTKVVQELGRADREDTGSIAFCPPPASLSSKIDVSIPSLRFAEVFVRPVPNNLVQIMLTQNNVQLTEYEHQNLITIQRFRWMFSDCQGKLPAPPDINVKGYETIVYPIDGAVEILPAFYLVNNYICPCLLLSIFKHFHKNNEINLGPFMIEPNVQIALSWLPPVAQLGLITIYLSLPQFRPRKGLAAFHVAKYKEFFDLSLNRIQAFSQAHRIYLSLSYISQSIANTKINVDPTWRKTSPYRLNKPVMLFDDEPKAFALFITEILMAASNWDGICALWGMYGPFYTSFMQNLDGLYDICTDPKVYLPVLEAQKSVFAALSPVDITGPMIDVQRTLNNFGAVMLSLGDQPVNYICGVHQENPIPSNYSPFANITQSPPQCVLENGVLITLVHAASCIKTFFCITDKVTFSERRRLSTRTETRVIHAQVVFVTIEGGNFEPAKDGTARLMAFDQFHRVLRVDNRGYDSTLAGMIGK
jgi:hypothetical protein